MGSPFKTAKFKVLHATWMKKLKKSGFEDIEKGDKLLRADSDWFHYHIDTLKFESTRDFYLQCVKFLNEHEFQTKEHEHIFGLFSQGKTLHEIENHVTWKKDKIASIIKQYLEIMRG